jgi:hypothetical protein
MALVGAIVMGIAYLSPTRNGSGDGLPDDLRRYLRRLARFCSISMSTESIILH